jgi:hypothetical protein
VAAATKASPVSSTASIEERYLQAILSLLRQQYQAIIRTDVAAVGLLYEKLAELLGGLQSETEPYGGRMPSYAPSQSEAIRPLVRVVREQMKLNQFLLSNGLLTADHFVRSMVPPSASRASFRLSGVA